MIRNRISSLTDEVHRLKNCGMYVDLVDTSSGTIRVGSMPDIAKFLSHHGFREEIIVVPRWEGSMEGDNRTGEEFVLWQAQVKGGICKHYVGLPSDIAQIHRNLNDTFSYFFDQKQISIIRKKWINKFFSKQIASPLYENGHLKIDTRQNNIIISDHGKIIYDRLGLKPGNDQNELVKTVFGEIAEDSEPRKSLEVTAIGTGNGFVGIISNFIVRFDRQVIWIDPCGYPAHMLAHRGINWNDVTHVLITHNREDHIQGFSACLKRAEHTGIPLNLITAPAIHKLLQRQFTPLCPGFKQLVNFIHLSPDKLLDMNGLRIESRWNHHFLPYGTLGLKITAGGKTFGFSGDTKFDDRINTLLGRSELLPEWFASSDLVFHEVDFDNPNSVHTHWKQLQLLQQNISGRLLCYHSAPLENGPLPQVEEGKTYLLE